MQKNCTVVRTEPRPTPQLFEPNEFRTRMIQVSRFERDLKYRGFHGQRPNVVFAEMEKNSLTKAHCGTFNGASYTSIVNMIISMGKTTLENLKSFNLPKDFIPKVWEEKYYIDN